MLALLQPDRAKTQQTKGSKSRDLRSSNYGAPQSNPVWQSLALRPVATRPKLTVGQPGAHDEQEADHVADRVMRMAPPASGNFKFSVSSDTSLKVQRKCTQCSGEEEEKLQRKAQDASTNSVETALPMVHETLRSPGQPLDPATRALMEPRFGHDFSQVRVHNDAGAAASANGLHAAAYTLGPDIVFAAGTFSPNTARGQRLLGHELTHVVQQRSAAPVAQGASVSSPGDSAEREADRVADALVSSNCPAPRIRERPTAGIARATLDVDALSTEVQTKASVGVQIGQAIRPMGLLFIKYLGAHPQGEIAKAADYPMKFKQPADKSKPVAPPTADASPPASNIPLVAHFFPATWPTITGRALVLGGFHGDEHPGWEVTDQLVKDLSQPSGNVGVGFHTMVIPRVNPAAIEDELNGVKMWRNRCNRQLVDLNRNFPTGKKAGDKGCANTDSAPVQPETQAVMDVIKKFKPDRILSTHAIGEKAHAGVFADPNQDPKAIELAKGMAATLVNQADRPFNKLGPGSFNPVYPGDKPGAPAAGTSLGVWGPTAVDPSHPVPVITMEAPEFHSLGTGAGAAPRTVEGFMRPVRAFLVDPAQLATQADWDILTDILAFSAADQLSFLTGKLSRKNDIFGRINDRVQTAIANLNAMRPKTLPKIEPLSPLRLFSETVPGGGGTSQSEIDFDKFFLTGGKKGGWDTLPDQFFINGDRSKGADRVKWLATPSKDRLDIIVRFSSLPGASRHHWNTEVDVNSTDVVDWQPAPALAKPDGKFFGLGQWLGANAAEVGLLQSYSPGRPAGGYADEPWHFSYAPLSIQLLRMYNQQVNLKTDVIDAVLAEFQKRASAQGLTLPTDFATALGQINVSDLVNKINQAMQPAP